MYETGQGCSKNTDSAFECLKEASERGNVYAMGNLVAHYYGKKLYTKAAELAARYKERTFSHSSLFINIFLLGMATF